MLGLSWIFIFITLLLFFSALFFGLFYKSRPIDALKYYGEQKNLDDSDEKTGKGRVGILKTLSKLVPDVFLRGKGREKLELELQMAGLLIKPEEMFVIRTILAANLALLLYLMTQMLIFLLVGIIAAWLMPNLVINIKKKERLKAFNEQINEGLMIISNSLKAGYSFMQAVALVAEETKDPFSREFKKLLKEMGLGMSIEESFAGMQKRMPSEDLRLIVNAILIQKDVGGNLSEILGNIGGTIRERQKIQGEIKTLTAQGKMSGFIVVALPFVLGGMIYLMDPGYMGLMFTTLYGNIMLGGAVMSQLIGIFAINKIIKIDV